MDTMKATNLRKRLYEILEWIASKGEPIEIVLGGKSVAILTRSPSLPATRRKPSLDLDAISDFCRRHGARKFSLFGSILGDGFDAESDVDVLLDLGGRHLGFHEEYGMIDELEAMFGRKVDLATDTTLERANSLRRQSIVESAREIYHATA